MKYWNSKIGTRLSIYYVEEQHIDNVGQTWRERESSFHHFYKVSGFVFLQRCFPGIDVIVCGRALPAQAGVAGSGTSRPALLLSYTLLTTVYQLHFLPAASPAPPALHTSVAPRAGLFWCARQCSARTAVSGAAGGRAGNRPAAAGSSEEWADSCNIMYCQVWGPARCGAAAGPDRSTAAQHSYRPLSAAAAITTLAFAAWLVGRSGAVGRSIYHSTAGGRGPQSPAFLNATQHILLWSNLRFIICPNWTFYILNIKEKILFMDI